MEKGTEKMVSEKTERWHKAKSGSVFPAKRRSVKKMMADRFVEVFKTVSPPPAAEASKSNKNNSVHPCSTELLAD